MNRLFGYVKITSFANIENIIEKPLLRHVQCNAYQLLQLKPKRLGNETLRTITTQRKHNHLNKNQNA